MKKALLIFFSMLGTFCYSCPTCEKAQPKLFRGITHGAGPDSNWDYLIIGITAMIALYCGYLMFARLIKPNELENEHIKNHFIY